MSGAVLLQIVTATGLAATPLGKPIAICNQRGPTPPAQPVAGPGSTEYAHDLVLQSSFGERERRFDLFEPASPTPQSAPIIVFLHGYGAVDYRTYGDWIGHLVRRGNTVIFPQYQDGYFTPAYQLTSSAAAAVRTALEVLETSGHVPPESDSMVLIGHSAGALIAANMAGRAAEQGLPFPAAVMLANPADTAFGFGQVYNSIYSPEVYARIPAQTLLLAVIGSDDRVAPDETSGQVLAVSVNVPAESKTVLRIYSDYHGCPRLIASHLAAGGVEEPVERQTSRRNSLPEDGRESREPRASALEFFGYWKWLDALTDTVRFDLHREYAFGDTHEQKFMGLWSDGVPVIPAEVVWP